MEHRKPNLALIVFFAAGHNREKLFNDREHFFEQLRTRFTLSVIPFDKFDVRGAFEPDTVYLPFIASGGSEELFIRYNDTLPAPFFLLYDAYHNSLPASLEIASAISDGKEGSCTVERIDSLSTETVLAYLHLQQTARLIRSTRAALVGPPSPWLVASTIDTSALTQMLGIQFTFVQPGEVIERYTNTSCLSPDNVLLQNTLQANSLPHSICSAELEKALTMHQCLESILKEKNANAITLRCFDLINECGASPCLSLALLNQKGIPAACEGDVPSLMTLLSAMFLTGKPAFMANPNAFDNTSNTVELAHCTLPLNMPQSYRLTTHFETGCSVAVDGRFVPGRPYTLVKWAKERLERFYVDEGTSIPCEYSLNRCRTQLKIQLDSSFESFQKKGMANHVILVEGHYKSLFERWNQYLTSLR